MKHFHPFPITCTTMRFFTLCCLEESAGFTEKHWYHLIGCIGLFRFGNFFLRYHLRDEAQE